MVTCRAILHKCLALSSLAVASGFSAETMFVCQHVHYLVTALGHKTLVTELYFATDPGSRATRRRTSAATRLSAPLS